MNTPQLETPRLILRKFAGEEDIEAVLDLKNEEVNTFLPWYPLKSIGEGRGCFRKAIWGLTTRNRRPYAYAIYLKSDNYPIGYIKVDMDESHDFGYGLRKNSGIRDRHRAGKLVVEQVKKDGLPMLQPHDIHNPLRRGVMDQLGMRYCYSYEEQWRPKNLLVTFRMYQLNLDGVDSRVYQNTGTIPRYIY